MECCSEFSVIKELFIDCPMKEIKRITSGLLKFAMFQVFKYESQVLIDPDP